MGWAPRCHGAGTKVPWGSAMGQAPRCHGVGTEVPWGGAMGGHLSSMGKCHGAGTEVPWGGHQGAMEWALRRHGEVPWVMRGGS